MPEDLEAWLAQHTEQAIDPELPICDPHHHLWDRPGNRYLLQDLLRDLGGGHRITRTVFLECSTGYRLDGPESLKPVGETEFVVEETALCGPTSGKGTEVAAGIVGFADLRLGRKVAPVLEAHIEAGEGRFRGIRHSAAVNLEAGLKGYKTPPQGLLLDPTFREGFSCLKQYGLSFDCWAYHPQLVEVVDLARAFPDVPIVLDHIGGPIGIGPYAGKRDEVYQAWKRGIDELATCPNVAIKLGGLGMPFCNMGWHDSPEPPTSSDLAKGMAPYYMSCIEQFGPDRCMFESNFPVDKVSFSYTVLWNAFKRLAEDFTPSEKAALFHGTAEWFYRL